MTINIFCMVIFFKASDSPASESSISDTNSLDSQSVSR